MWLRISLIVFMIFLSRTQTWSYLPSVQIANLELLDDHDNKIVLEDGKLKSIYNDTIFQSELNCRNDNLQIFDNNRTNYIEFKYSNMPALSAYTIRIQVTPNIEPKPFVSATNDSYFVLNFNCSGPYSSRNYFNEVKIWLMDSYSFSFLLDCDPENRHKQFEVGYIMIAIINTAIIVGVAMFSHVWSIKINLKPLRVQLKWIPFLIFSVAGSVAIILLLKFAFKESGAAFNFIRYGGIVIAIPFTFLCFNEIFFIATRLKKRVFKFLRWCDVISLALTVVVITFAFIFQNWIFYDFLAGLICVGSIKIFHFQSLKQAFASMLVLFTSVTLLAIILHYILPRSYNDYAGELSSPLFLQVPDLVFNLYKKCSWLPTLDVILPGVTLSYLRVHDKNKSSRWGGVYTVTGNLTFVLATITWIGIEYIYPYSVPFSLVTYPLLMLSIFVIAWRRSEWPTLYKGQFIQEDEIDPRILAEDRKSFTEHVPNDHISQLLIQSLVPSPNSSSIFTD